MTLDELFVGGGVGAIAVLSLLEIAPITVSYTHLTLPTKLEV